MGNGVAEGIGLGTKVDEVPLEVLERRLTGLAARIAAAEAEWMADFGEYIRREGWVQWGCSGAAHWLSWKCGMSPSAARERVRVASALRELPLIQGQFAAGRLSYSKVQALTRVANEHNEDDLVSMAVNATGAQLARICSGYRNSFATSDDAVAKAMAKRRFTKRRNHDGTTTYTLVVADAETQRIDDHVDRVCTDVVDDAVAVDASADGLDPRQATRRQAIGDRGGIAAMRADAAVALLVGEASQAHATPAAVTLIVAADQSQDPPKTSTDDLADTCAQAYGETQIRLGAGFESLLGGYSALAASASSRLTCDSRIQALIESADRGPLAVGRHTRLINRRLRRALMRRDNACCQFPGCHATRRLHAHHIIHWSNDGNTEIDNLILVCNFHHHLVHEGGWSIDANRCFVRPDRTTVDPAPDHLRASADPVEPHTWPGDGTGPLEPPNMSPFDLPWTTAILHHNETLRRRETQAA